MSGDVSETVREVALGNEPIVYYGTFPNTSDGQILTGVPFPDLPVRLMPKTHAGSAWGGSAAARCLPRAGPGGVGNTPISKNRRSTGVAPRGENVALGKENRSRGYPSVRFVTKTHAGGA